MKNLEEMIEDLTKEDDRYTAFLLGYEQSLEDDSNDFEFNGLSDLSKHLQEKFDEKVKGEKQ